METPSQTLHRLTCYEHGRDWDEPADDPRILRDLVPNDLDRLPWFYKRYSGSLPVVPLPRDLPATAAPAVAVLAGTAEIARAELDLPHLSRLLHLSAGVVRTSPRPYGTYLFRAAGSAGGRFPSELYVAVPEGGTLPPGVHWYHPQEHALVQVGRPPRGDAVTVVVTGIPWRTGWRYAERGYRHVFWDAGTMLAQLLAAAESAGAPPALYSTFPDAAVAALVGADRVHELPVAVVALGEGEPALEATGPAAAGEVDAAPVEFPLVTPAYRAGERDALGAPWPAGEPVDVPGRGAAPVEDVILARGSQRLMDPARGLSQEVLLTSMSAALRGIDLPHFVVVHDVEGLEPGVYRWPDLTAPVRKGDLREELYRVCLDQGLCSDAAFVVISAARVAELDDRAYRAAQLASGVVEGRLHLLAYALGASASGMTFDDSLIHALLGEPLDGLLFTCVGVPEYAAKAGG
ncbi:MAG TPA: nitroreductase family protein, partial [Actinomycetota bacterium]|nr:nitroreductase family protein [Actinomycetota bacterium]